MTTEIENKLTKYFFPIEEKKVLFKDTDNISILTNDYKAIVRTDNNKLISIMKDSYNLIPNKNVILSLMEQLHKLDTKWNFDNSHSFVDNNRMRLQITFPDLILNDGRSDIALSLFLHNSYDGSEGVRIFWGAIRDICSNGMVFGKVLAKFYGKHTRGIDLSDMKQQIEKTYNQIPIIKKRIDILQNLSVNQDLINEVENNLGKRVFKYVNEQKPIFNQWALYNILTYYISHLMEQRLRAAYQLKVSRLFNL
jgi:hypothetical protein